ncbi:uncharacterized protein [Ptychodera flava]|uniref:uncharacterized protein n=1 Tax=Ptychodera flava TaxID=63121 RepID=UPI003969EFF4
MNVDTLLLLCFLNRVQKTAALENVALNKSVDGMEIMGNARTYPYLTDGVRHTCAETTQEMHEPTFVIDLGGYYRVSSIILDNELNACNRGRALNSFEITIGASNNRTENTICVKASNSKQYIRLSFDCTEPIIGRYATLTKTMKKGSGRMLCTCEMEVFGEFVDPVISCPEDIKAYALPDKKTENMTWSVPLVSNFSSSLTVSGSHDRGSEFVLGNTVVTYTAVDTWNNSVSCRFTVTLRESLLDGILANLSNIGKMNGESTAETLRLMERLSDVAFSLPIIYPGTLKIEKTVDIANAILELLDTLLTLLRSYDDINATIKLEEYINHLISVAIDTVDNCSKFVLDSALPGNGPIIFETPSVIVHLEKDAPEEICDKFVSLGVRNGFQIPPHTKLRLTTGVAINLVAICLRRTSLPTMEDKSGLTDVLSLSFTDKNGSTIDIPDAEEDIGILYGLNRSDSGNYTSGVYAEGDDETYFGWTFQISKQTDAMSIVVIRSSEVIRLNATVHVQFFNEDVLRQADDIRSHDFSRDIRFSKREVSFIIPNQESLTRGKCYLNVTIPHRQTVKLSLLLRQQMCQYFNKQTARWNTEGCMASYTSLNNTILCLCKGLPT